MKSIILSIVLLVALVSLGIAEGHVDDKYNPDYFNRNLSSFDTARRASRNQELGNPQKVKEIMDYVDALNKENSNNTDFNKIEEVALKQERLCSYLGYGGENGARILVDLMTTGKVGFQGLYRCLGEGGTQTAYKYLMGVATTDKQLINGSALGALVSCTYYYSDEQNKKIFDLCVSFADSKDPEDRAFCASCLGKLKNRAAIPILEKLALDETKDDYGRYIVKQNAVEAITEIRKMKETETRYSNARYPGQELEASTRLLEKQRKSE